MVIHIDNYEGFALDYIEGNLTPEMQRSMEEFLYDNPDIKEDILQISTFRWPVEKLEYPNKKDLLKTRRIALPVWTRVAAGLILLMAVLWMLKTSENKDEIQSTDLVSVPLSDQNEIVEDPQKSKVPISEEVVAKEYDVPPNQKGQEIKSKVKANFRNPKLEPNIAVTEHKIKVDFLDTELPEIETNEILPPNEEELLSENVESTDKSQQITYLVSELETSPMEVLVQMDRKVDFVDILKSEEKNSPFIPLAFNKLVDKKQIKNSLVPTSFGRIFTK
jgi:hypothetical protein